MAKARRRRWGPVAGLLMIALLVVRLPTADSSASAASPAAPAQKKTCKMVTKKVHGKKKKVKVCKAVKPLPADREATVLANAVYSASTDDARARAILKMMKALHVSVYAGTGKRVVRGTAQRPADFFLYDFEVTALAAAIGKGESIPVTQLAATFNALGIRPRDRPLDADHLQRALAIGVGDALKAPAAPSSLPVLLIRDLGLRHTPPYDLAQAAGGSPVALDPLQSFLLMAEVLLPIPSVRALTAAHAVNAPAAGSGPCDFKTDSSTATLIALLGIAGNSIWKGLSSEFSQEIAAIAGYIKATLSGTLGTALTLGAEVIDLVHMNILAATVDVTAEPTTEQRAHYGPAGHEAVLGVPGKELDFTVHVEMTADLGQTLISCGPLVGLKFPPKGPLKGVSVKWEDDLLSAALDKFGTVSFNPADQTTGADGNSTAIFKPNQEIVPGIGKEIVQTGTLLGNAAYQSPYAAFKIAGVPITAGFVLENAYPKQGIFDWEVDRHVARGFKFDNAVWEIDERNVDPVFGVSTGAVTETWSGRICGADPYTDLSKPDTLWQFHVQNHEVYTGTDGQVTVTDVPATGPFPVVQGLNQADPDESWQFMPGTSGDPQMAFTFVVPDPTDPGTTLTSPKTQYVTVPVTEDTSCPEPTP